MMKEPVNEMLPEHFTIADGIDAGRFLLVQPDHGGIALAARQQFAFQPPLRPQLLGFGKPRRFGQTACDRGFEHESSECGETVGAFYNDMQLLFPTLRFR